MHLCRKRFLETVTAPIGNFSFRVTDITAYLANCGQLEHAQEMAGQESPRNTQILRSDKGAPYPG
jgi:hypothetical protein